MSLFSSAGGSLNTGLSDTSAAFAKPATGGGGGSSRSAAAHNALSTKLLKDLLESASNFPKLDLSDLGSIQLTVRELQKKTNLLRRQPAKPPSSFTRAHYLLASSGVSADDIETQLNSLESPDTRSSMYGLAFGKGYPVKRGRFEVDTARPTTAPAPSAVTTTTAVPSSTTATNGDIEDTTNLDNYLRNKKDENILAAIELSLTTASKDFDAFVAQNVSIDWKARKDQLRETFGIHVDSLAPPRGGASFNWNKTNSNNYNLLAPLLSKPSSSFSSKQLTREKFETHAQIVYHLNEARLQEEFYPLALSFEEVCKTSSNLKLRQVGDSWKILVDLTDEKLSKFSQEKKFEGRSHTAQLLRSSRRYLETQFFEYVDRFYNKDDGEKLPPSNINKVVHFINKVTNSAHDKKPSQGDGASTLVVNGVPIWALIFYLLRAGLYHEANDVVTNNHSSFHKFDKNFPVYLKRYLEGGNNELPMDLNERLQGEFNQQFQFINEDLTDTYDVYKYSVYKVIGKCDLSKKALPQSLNLSIEDWLWFHLSLVNVTDDTDLSARGSGLLFETYTLADLQKLVILVGPKKFNASSNNPLYLKSLILCGLYELAVQYTFEYINECDAVHLAIGLSYYGLLHCSAPATLSAKEVDELMVIKDGEFAINLGRLLGSYTRTFKLSDTKVACQYAMLIAMERKQEGNLEVCWEALRELILVSREFGVLLGGIDDVSGERLPGILEKQRALIGLENLDTFDHIIIEKLASRCEEEGRIFDAITLYQLAREYNTAIVLLLKLLGEILSTTPLDKPLLIEGVDTVDNNVILLARHILQTFNQNPTILEKVSPHKKESLDLLIAIVDIRISFLQKRWNATIDQILKLDLIPVSDKLDLMSIRRSAELIANSLIDDNVIKVIPLLLITIMTSLSQWNYAIVTRRYNSTNNQRDELDSIHKMAKNCMIYAGMVQYKMPRETYSLLVNLEALL